MKKRAASAAQVRLGRPAFLSLLVLFLASGCAALIYQVVWLQLLELVIGSSAISMGILLTMFMAGMCAGSLALPRLIGPAHHPLNVYAALELGIGVLGLVLLFTMPLVNRLYAATGGGVAFRAIAAGICLLPPTMMMGATLPAVARWVESTPRGVSWLGFFYAANIAGAAIGSLVTGFYLLRVFDMGVATYAAVVLNVVTAIAARQLASRLPYVPSSPGAVTAAANAVPHVHHRVAVYTAIGLSGLTALAAEIIWTRLLSLSVGATVYAFSLILAAFLCGLGIGSSLGATLARHSPIPRRSLAWCQFLLALAIAWAAYLLAERLPFSPVIASGNPWTALRFDLLRCLAVVLPGAILWGASFPLALASAANRGDDAGRLVGGIYAANTIGAIVGAMLGVALAASVGSQTAQRTLIVFSTLSGTVLLGAELGWSDGSRRARTAIVGIFVAVAGVLTWRVAPIPAALIAYGRNSASWAGVTPILFTGEGLNSFVAVSRTPSGAPIYHAAGKVQASSEGEDLRLQRMLAHFSHLIPKQPRNVLVIGLGAGITAGAIAIAPDVERVTVVEIEKLSPAVAHYFAGYNYGVIDNPKVEVRIDDARHFLLTSKQKFDVITSDLVDPWVKGTAALFTEEFFTSVKDHLAPGGVVTMFVQLYLSNIETVKSEIATFTKVFPHTIVWGNTLDGQGYDLVLTAQVDPLRIDVDEWQRTLSKPEYAPVAQSLRDIGIGSAVALVSHYAATTEDLRSWLSDAVVNRDRNLRLQFLAGMGLDLQQSGPIYADLIRRAGFPTDQITGSPATIQALQEAIARARGRAAGRDQ